MKLHQRESIGMDRIIGGTNTRPTWDEVWMDMARIIGQRSKCSRDKVGAVIVPEGNGEGFVGSYNGPPSGWSLADDGPCTGWCQRSQPGKLIFHRDYSDCPSAHAEQNAITRADFSKIRNASIYVSSSVCFTCAKLVANSGIGRVLMKVDPTQEHRKPDATIEFLTTSGLEVEVWQAGIGVQRAVVQYQPYQKDLAVAIDRGVYGSQLAW
jgi:dCMP deaminase